MGRMLKLKSLKVSHLCIANFLSLSWMRTNSLAEISATLCGQNRWNTIQLKRLSTFVKKNSPFAQKLITFSFFQEHFYLETQATIAVPRGEDGEMELFVSTQNPTLTQVGKHFLLLLFPDYALLVVGRCVWMQGCKGGWCLDVSL